MMDKNETNFPKTTLGEKKFVSELRLSVGPEAKHQNLFQQKMGCFGKRWYFVGVRSNPNSQHALQVYITLFLDCKFALFG